jgi:hypothetical protein
VERETGNGKRETLWEESVGAVVKGFETAFRVDTILKNGPSDSLRLSAAPHRAHA